MKFQQTEPNGNGLATEISLNSEVYENNFAEKFFGGKSKMTSVYKKRFLSLVSNKQMTEP